jgi:hypothetical protein
MLTLAISQQTYAVTVRSSGVLLEKPGGAVYEVRPETDPALSCGVPYACDCPDYLHRHRGNPTGGCKHVKAALEAGLIPA